jgi:ABC-type multidrug transport system fused ATPase/permease subunit
MCLVTVPIMGISFYMILQSGAGNDGLLGKEAYEAAANIADETLSSMPTVASFVGETKAAARYESHLGEAESAAIRQSKTLGIGTGMLWGSFFTMMGIGFWWGGRLVIESHQQAMIDNPLPADFYTNDIYAVNRAVADEFCNYNPPGSFGSGELVAYTGDAYDACVCSIPWSTLGIEGVVDIQCGCSKDELSIASDCVTAGRTIAVFFSVMIAGFLLGMIPPAFQAIKKAQLAAYKLYRIIDRHPTIDSSSTDGKKLVTMEGRISIENLHFQYPTASTKTFEDINLEIAAGETVALVGESGSGKSTIARLINRFYDPQEGRVCIDGNDLRDLDVKSMRDHIGIVSQEPLLFDDTIAENIARGKVGAKATIDEIEAAARAANAYSFIQSFPDGFNTKVGARGSKLSGGKSDMNVVDEFMFLFDI